MTIAEQQRWERHQYQSMVAEIVRGITAEDEPVALSLRLSEESGLDHQLVYRWVQFVEDRLERRRRRAAIGLVALLWPGVLAVVVAVLAAVFGWFPGVVAGALGVAGIAAALGAGVRLVGLRQRVYAQWLEEEQAEAEYDKAEYEEDEAPERDDPPEEP